MLVLKLTIFLSVLMTSISLPLENTIGIKDFKYEIDGLGNYQYNFETDDGVRREEKGEIIKDASNNISLVVHGVYSYIGSNGEKYEVTYVADDQGFHPKIVNSYGLSDKKPETLPLPASSTEVSFGPALVNDAIKTLQGNVIGK